MCELLSPVGNMDSLMAAINAGCNAVYLSGKNFGARSFAGNFSRDELIEVINTCHLYGVKVYVTVNTLIYDDEVERFIEYIDFLHSNNVDAVIMQDIGMIDLVRKMYPNLEIHMSTQGSICNREGVRLCEELGIKRVVIARETPIELIKYIKEKTNIEIEVFVHGALCMSYSGQCLMSALIGSRSGNRGTCAQCCRQQYSLEIDGKIVEKDKYLLSTKDLNTLEYLGELIDIGVDSLKIEGRMKRPEYVYLVTSIYRKSIDNYNKTKEIKVTKEDIVELKKIFNRDFTKGFIFNEENDNYVNTYRSNHLGIEIGKIVGFKNGKAAIKLKDNLSINDGIRIVGEKEFGSIVTYMTINGKSVKEANPGDIVTIEVTEDFKLDDTVLKTTDYNQLKLLNKNINTNKKIKINAICTLKVGNPILLSLNDGINEINVESDFIVEKSINNPTSKEEIKDKLSRLGNTIYEYNNLDIIMDKDIFVSNSKLNEIRRLGIEKLNEKRLYKIGYKKESYKIDIPDFDIIKNINVLINSYDEYLKCKDKYDLIYVDDMDLYNKINDNKCILRLPRISEKLKDYDIKLLVNDLGSVYKYKNADTDFSLNVFNSYSVAFLHSLGVNKITLSYELNYKQIKRLVEYYKKRYNKHPNLEVIVESNEEAMICKYNMLKKYNKDKAYLIDRFNNKYKVKVKNNFMYIYNFRRRKLEENYFDIGINNIRINL